VLPSGCVGAASALRPPLEPAPKAAVDPEVAPETARMPESTPSKVAEASAPPRPAVTPAATSTPSVQAIASTPSPQPQTPSPRPPTPSPSPSTRPSPSPAASASASPVTPSPAPTFAGLAVTAFGARGDGVTDDTAAVHRARDAAGQGGTVLFPAGTYIVGKLQLNVAGQTWRLDPAATIRLRASANSSLISASGVGVRLIGGRLDGNRLAQTSSGNCVSVSGSKAVVESVDVGNCRGWGIYVHGADDVQLLRNTVHDTNLAAIFVESDTSSGADNTLIQNNTIRRTFSESAGGIIVHGNNATLASVGSRIIGNHVEAVAQISIEVWGLAHRSVIQGNTTIGGWMGISVDRSDDSIVSGNTVRGPRLYGIELAGSSRCTVRENLVDGAGAAMFAGVALTGNKIQSHASTIVANKIYRATRGVQLNSGSSGNTITGNLIDGWTKFGIELITSDDTHVSANTIQNGSNQGITVDNTSRVEITRNTVHRANAAVWAYGHDGVVVDHLRITDNRFVEVSTGLLKSGTVGSDIIYLNN
jgi:parallel beta-helix repeat protein